MNRKCMMFLAVMAVAPSVFALNGKTLFNYFAYESIFWNKGTPVTAENYAKQYLNGVAKVPFDTMVVTPYLGFGAIAGILQNSVYPTHQPQGDSSWMKNMYNAMPELVKKGIDPIGETVKWCRARKKEVVVMLPVNLQNTHTGRPSAKNAPNSWYCFMFSDFQKKHPECLMNPDGKANLKLRDGSSCVDYTQALVRDKFSNIACEIAGKYDLDGILVDFTMMPILFKSVQASGTAASAKELEAITAMMTKIKAVCAAASTRLGHKVAFGARVPDSVGYCKDIGINLQAWLDAKMLDFVVFGGAFQLNRWKTCGDLANKAGIPWYVSFTHSGITVFNDSGYSGDDERMRRNSPEVCRARIAEALLSKATGAMFSMGQHWEVQMSPGCVVPFDAKANRIGNKRYFVSYTNDRVADRYLTDGCAKYRGVPSLLSTHPVELAKGLQKYEIDLWEDFDGFKRDGINFEATLIIEAEIPSGVETIVTFNGKEQKCFKKRAGTQLYKLSPGLIKHGANEVTVKSKGKNRRGNTARLGNICVEVTFPKKEAGK